MPQRLSTLYYLFPGSRYVRSRVLGRAAYNTNVVSIGSSLEATGSLTYQARPLCLARFFLPSFLPASISVTLKGSVSQIYK